MAHPAKDARDKAQAKWPGATVFARGQKHILHKHPVEERFMLDAQIGPMHYGSAEDQEIDTAWQAGTAPWDYEMVKADYNAFALQRFDAGQIIKYVDPDSGEDIAFQPQQLQYTNDLDQIQPIEDPQTVNAVVADDELYWTGAFGNDIDLKWETQTARLDKRVVIHNAAALPAAQQFIIDGGNPVFRLQFIFQKSTNVEIWVNGVLWDEKANNPVETSGYIEWRHKTSGEVLWTFNLPRSFEASATEFFGIFGLRKTGPNLFVEHRIPISWLQSATYPIEIDTTIDPQVDTGYDDATEDDDGTDFGNDGWLFASSDTDAFNRKNAGANFAILGLTNGDTVDVAYASFNLLTVDADDANVTVYCEDVDDADDFNDTQDVTSRTTTSASGSWIGDGLGTGWANTGTIVDAVQEVVDRGGFSAGNDLVVLAKGNADADKALMLYSYDNNTANAPKLHIEYTAAAAGNPYYAYAQQ